ncbi:hypothetical protein AWB78_02386 [Caballeronia calidae]|uniref:Uncharacterized protein n=1 Tax=Caballeronia calidae TaxID=1777139 RepID=A0A158B7Y0_9BURK|nr:hypothetical protein AWB78_02386 [Caballeronia calidae]
MLTASRQTSSSQNHQAKLSLNSFCLTRRGIINIQNSIKVHIQEFNQWTARR